jgi:hypothetical protein
VSLFELENTAAVQVSLNMVFLESAECYGEIIRLMQQEGKSFGALKKFEISETVAAKTPADSGYPFELAAMLRHQSEKQEKR